MVVIATLALLQQADLLAGEPVAHQQLHHRQPESWSSLGAATSRSLPTTCVPALHEIDCHV
jgi:hypothetical protein